MVYFINTTGIGIVPDGVRLSANQARPGDRVILSGSIGDHGIAILATREGLEFETEILSDSAALHNLVARCWLCHRRKCYPLSARPHAGRCFERPQRNRHAIAGQHPNRGNQDPGARGSAGRLRIAGLDPLYVANEGSCWRSWRRKRPTRLLAAMRRDAHGTGGGHYRNELEAKVRGW